MNKFKVLTVVGTRPELIRLARVIPCLDDCTTHVLVHTGQNYDYELNEIFFTDLALRKPDHFLDAAGASAVATIGNILIKIDQVLEQEKPDAFLVLGDTNSCVAVIAAKRRKIPVFHMEAGNRCFDERVPEEINRKLVDHLSDMNLPYSQRARELLLREGLLPDRIVVTGSPMYEVIHHHLPKAMQSDIVGRLTLKAQDYFLVSAHREENVDAPERLRELIATLNLMAETYGNRIVVSTHPRTRLRIEALSAPLHALVELHKPFSFTDYLALELNARVVLSDSGTITEESAILNFPALNIRDTHERPEGMEEAAVIMTGLASASVMAALDVALMQPRGDARMIRIPPDYAVPNVSQKVLRIILSYTDFVNRTVWRKHA